MAAGPNPPVSDWLAEAGRLTFQAHQIAEHLTEEQFNRRPGPDKWSAGECLSHLAIVTGLVAGKLKPALEQARSAGKSGSGPFKYGLIGSWFVRTMEAPGKRPMPTPENFAPPSGLAKAEVMAAFDRSYLSFREALALADGLALDRIRAASTAKGAGRLSLNSAAWFASTLAHTRRHLQQAERAVGTEKRGGLP
ncbi:MAG: DinB family protein [Gemmatimonadales bacterium]|nr:DinB family protein [Gemmatimonadales bacterium]